MDLETLCLENWAEDAPPFVRTSLVTMTEFEMSPSYFRERIQTIWVDDVIYGKDVVCFWSRKAKMTALLDQGYKVRQNLEEDEEEPVIPEEAYTTAKKNYRSTIRWETDAEIGMTDVLVTVWKLNGDKRP